MEQESGQFMKNDVFADIANQRITQRDDKLVQPSPENLKEIFLPVSEFENGKLFKPVEKLKSAEQLHKELKKARERFAPFMADHAPPIPQTKTRMFLEQFDWRVQAEPDKTDFERVLAGDGYWKKVTIPHYGEPLGLATTYYRTVFSLTEEQLSQGALFIHFKGVDYKAHVFINGNYLGSHDGFFAPFEFDFTHCARRNENILVVKVENDFLCRGNAAPASGGITVTGDKLYAATGLGYDDPKLGWHHCPPGMGIYQEVYVESRPRVFIKDIFVRPVTERNGAEAWLEIWNCNVLPENVSFELSLFGQNFEQEVFTGMHYKPGSIFAVGMGDTLTEAHAKNSGSSMPVEMEKGINYLRVFFPIQDIRLWEADTPWLYQLQVSMSSESGEILDCEKQQFGMRFFKMDTENEPKGMFYFNGRRIRLRGANTMGHEQQCVFKKDFAQLRDDILLAKLCNINFLRITQRPVQPEIYDYCDRLGLMLQTDLPLFGVLRRNQFCEALRQIEEMEKLIRSHPCCVLMSYINEPFPNGGNKPQRNLSREDLISFFESADRIVHLNNPDRVIKAIDGDYDPPGPGLPDNHCYCGWYNGHGIDVGKLHKGYWQHVKPGWYYGCGEFGAEGLDPENVMRKYYPKEWLPQSTEEEKGWSPVSIVKSQTGAFHYFFYDTPSSLKEWVSTSHKHQEWVIRFMTEAFRRDSKMATFAVHLFIDAFPSGWMKALMDVDRQPKPAYFAYRDALTPLLVQLRTDRYHFYGNEYTLLEAWICNDKEKVPENAVLEYYLEMEGKVIYSGRKRAEIPLCSSLFQGLIRINVPTVERRTGIEVHAGLLDGSGNVLHDCVLKLEAFPRIYFRISKRIMFIGKAYGKAVKLVSDIVSDTAGAMCISEADVIVVDDYESYKKVEKEVIERVLSGAVVIFPELPEGKYEIAGSRVKVKSCGMSPLHFVSRDTGHKMVEGFEPEDFRLWYDPEAGYITPILDTTFTADNFEPILKTGNTDDAGIWRPAMAAAEKKLGAGAVLICQVKLAGRTGTNPTARKFMCRMFGME